MREKDEMPAAKGAFWDSKKKEKDAKKAAVEERKAAHAAAKVNRRKQSQEDMAWLEARRASAQGKFSWLDELFTIKILKELFGAIKASLPGQGESKRKRKPITVASIIEGTKANKMPIFIGVCTILMVILVAGGDDWAKGDFGSDSYVDHYAVMGLHKDATQAEIKNVYRKLSIKYHPDRVMATGKECDEDCQERFAKIGAANAVLSDPEKRSLYDRRGRSGDNALKSQVSIELDSSNYEQLVSNSNDVWIIQAYDPDEGFSSNFHPHWEQLGMDMKKHAKFGRVAKEDVGAIRHFPYAPKIFPTVMRVGKNCTPEFFNLPDVDKKNGFARFFVDNFPKWMPTFGSADEADTFGRTASELPRVVLVAPKSKGLKSLPRQRIAYRWNEVFTFGHLEEGMSNQRYPAGSMSLFPAEGADKPLATLPMPDDDDEIDHILRKFAMFAPPLLTVRNHELLCRSSDDEDRTLCLTLVDADLEKAKEVADEVVKSRKAHAAEIEELRASGAEVSSEEEKLSIQVVRVDTASPSFSQFMPSPTVSGNKYWKLLHAENEHADAFVVELEPLQSAPVKASRFADIYQQIALGDVPLQPLNVPFDACLPNLEIPFKVYCQRSFAEMGIFMKIVFLMISVFLVEATSKLVATKNWNVLGGLGALFFAYLLRTPPFVLALYNALIG